MSNYRSMSPSQAHQLFAHDVATGALIWKPRGEDKRFNTRFAGKPAGCRSVCTVGKAYIQVRVDRVLYYAHRIAWAMHNGVLDPAIQVDHENGDGTDNRKANLRAATDSRNKRNQRKMASNTSGVTGVYLDKRHGGYFASSWQRGKTVHLGSFRTIEAAAECRLAYQQANSFHPNHGQERPL